MLRDCLTDLAQQKQDCLTDKPARLVAVTSYVPSARAQGHGNATAGAGA